MVAAAPRPHYPAELLARVAARAAAEARGADLLALIARVSPHLDAPHHLAPYAAALERVGRGEAVRMVFSAPPQHGKTVLTVHALVWLVQRHPTKRFAYVTYAQKRADSVSRQFKRLADRAGLALEGNLGQWLTAAGGQLLFRGVEGSLTGEPIDGMLVIDDPIRGREEAESVVMREKVWDFWTDEAYPRCHPGSSQIVMATRWHVDDLSGRLIAAGADHLNLPAISDAGDALWPARRPLAWLREREAAMGAYSFAALYQGAPRPRGGAVFGPPTFVPAAAVPTRGLRVAIGADFAYSSRTYADYSVAVVIGADGAGRYYLLDVVRRQVEAPTFAADLKRLSAAWPGAPITAFIGGTEKGVVDFMRTQGVRVSALPATADKFTRAQDVAAVWNRSPGAVLVPQGAPWSADFVAEICSFTGVGDKHDDQVDALAGAFVPFARPATGLTMGTAPLLAF